MLWDKNVEQRKGDAALRDDVSCYLRQGDWAIHERDEGRYLGKQCSKKRDQSVQRPEGRTVRNIKQNEQWPVQQDRRSFPATLLVRSSINTTTTTTNNDINNSNNNKNNWSGYSTLLFYLIPSL